MRWETIAAPPGLMPPRPMTVRAQSIPARHYFPEHAHRWNQAGFTHEIAQVDQSVPKNAL